MYVMRNIYLKIFRRNTMKKLFCGLFLAGMFMVYSCSLTGGSNSGSPGSSSNSSDSSSSSSGSLSTGSLTVSLETSAQSGASGISKSVITVTSNEIIGATITLAGGNNQYSTNWAPGQSLTYTFQTLNLGAYTLTVTDWDNAGHTNIASTVINILSGYNYTISVLLGGQVYISQPNNIPRTGLVAEYLLDGNAVDSSGNGNNGTVNSAVLTGDRFGNANSAFNFINESIDCGDGSSIKSITSAVTVCFWVNPAANSSGGGGMVGHCDNNLQGGWSVQGANNGHLMFSVWTGNAGNPNSAIRLTNSITPGKWSFVVAAYNATSGVMSLSVNGSAVSSSGFYNGNLSSVNPQPQNPGCQDLTIGLIWSWGQNTSTGVSIDDVRVYNRSLSSTEIQSIYMDTANE